MEPLVILGGGLAGLAAARFAEAPWLLVEREARVGGLARTEVLHGGFHFDPTGHWLHLRDADMRRWVTEELLPGGLVEIQRRAAIHSRGVFTRFPYQVNTHGLPPEVVIENVLGFIEAHWGEAGRALRERPPRTFEDFILRHLGAGFAKNFMVPYNQKLWTVPPSELSAEWCGRFVPKPGIREVLEGALGAGSDRIGYNASFLYPRMGGIEALPRAILASLAGGEVRTAVEPLTIDWRSKRLELSDGSVLTYRKLVSTLPLPRLVELLARGSGGVPDEVRAAAAALRATTVTYVNAGCRTPNRHPWHWVYLPEESFRAYRIGSPSAALSTLAPPGTSSFYVEFSHRGELTPQEAERLARVELVASGMVGREEDLLFAEAREIPLAYVLYDEAYGPAMRVLEAFLGEAGVLTAGRYGRWEYSSMEDALLEGRAAAWAAAGKMPSRPSEPSAQLK